MTDLTQLVAALGALFAALVGAFKLLLTWQARRLEKGRDKWLSEAITETLIQAATQAGPNKTRVLDIAFCEPNVSLCIPVVLDQWITLPWGIFIQGFDFGHSVTTYLVKCDNTARLLTHSHEGMETVTVIQGTMVDLDTGTTYRPGDTWEIPARTPHRVHFDAPLDDCSFLAMVTVKPPLPNPIQRPIDLSALPRLLARTP